MHHITTCTSVPAESLELLGSSGGGESLTQRPLPVQSSGAAEFCETSVLFCADELAACHVFGFSKRKAKGSVTVEFPLASAAIACEVGRASVLGFSAFWALGVHRAPKAPVTPQYKPTVTQHDTNTTTHHSARTLIPRYPPDSSQNQTLLLLFLITTHVPSFCIFQLAIQEHGTGMHTHCLHKTDALKRAYRFYLMRTFL
jgi:hypothetical protein